MDRLPYGKWAAAEQSASNHRLLWITPGFAHGFLVLSDSANFLYKTTACYAPAFERSIRWDDPEIDIRWPATGLPPILSGKDASAPFLHGLAMT
jgi:dTDP-4-dehydrorhamnose 3,5-epimerase